MRQYFLSPIKWCLQEDQRGWTRQDKLLWHPHPHTDLLHAPAAPQKVSDLLEMPLFYGLIAAKAAPSPQTKIPFLLQPGHRANAGLQVLGWLLHMPMQAPPSQPCFCHRHEEKGAQRIIQEWTGEIIGSFKAEMTCTAMQAQDFILQPLPWAMGTPHSSQHQQC